MTLQSRDKQLLVERAQSKIAYWREDWNRFAYDALDARLDKEQQEIISSVQFNPRTSVASGTARGKDFVTAVAAVSFMYLTPRWNGARDLVANTKVALTGPTDRQVKNIMMPEIARRVKAARKKGIDLPGRLLAYDIRTDWEEWFLTGFKADENQHEAWSGFHAVNTMFAVTEATGISDDTFEAIEGNLQGNSRILLVFNPNTTVGYAATSQRQARWHRFRLNSLSAPNVIEKRIIIPGQVDYPWVRDKIDNWCTPIQKDEVRVEQNDFEFEGSWYRPSDLFRKKVLGHFPKVAEDVIIPPAWVELAQERWKKYHATKRVEMYPEPLRLGVDVAGMGRDNSVYCPRHGNIVREIEAVQSAGVADHMATAGRIVTVLRSDPRACALIDTIGEGAGVYSAVVDADEDNEKRTASAKFSEGAVDDYGDPLNDESGQYTFLNMRAYCLWAVRDWLNPMHNHNAMLPPDDALAEEIGQTRWKFSASGAIQIEKKEDIIKRLKRSPDRFDALALTFFPFQPRQHQDLSGFFF